MLHFILRAQFLQHIDLKRNYFYIFNWGRNFQYKAKTTENEAVPLNSQHHRDFPCIEPYFQSGILFCNF
jgi:hypothetical protein